MAASQVSDRATLAWMAVGWAVTLGLALLLPIPREYWIVIGLLALGVPFLIADRTFPKRQEALAASLRRRMLPCIEAELHPVGLSPDKQWLVALRPYAEVGPGTLVAVNISRPAHRTLHENVYECSLADKP